MQPHFHKGFIVYNRGFHFGNVFITQHTGPSLETPTNRDTSADTVASLCWMDMGGNLVIGTCPRKRMFGIDFNRASPKKKEAIKFFNKFRADVERKKLQAYRNKYAWVAKNSEDHKNRKKIYNDFWSSLKRSGDFYVFVHSQWRRIKNYPSLLDVISFDGKGVDDKIIKNIIEGINEEYKKRFKEIEKHFKEAIMLESNRVANRAEVLFGGFDIKNMEVEYRLNMQKDLVTMRQFADKKVIEKLEKDFSKSNYMTAVKNTLKKGPHPHVTLNTNFNGALAKGPKTQLHIGRDNITMELEVNEFFGRFYPKDAADIINRMIRNIKQVKKYKKWGYKQKQILEFMKHDN